MQKSDQTVRIVRLFDLPLADIQPLLLESRTQNYRFVDRLVDEYVDGSNRFGLLGEALYAAYVDNRMVGIGGLNRDPYVGEAEDGDMGVGRVRHLYVLSDWRGRGVGGSLMEQITDEARQQFAVLTLRTFSPDAANFYVAIGFEATADVESVTHRLVLTG